MPEGDPDRRLLEACLDRRPEAWEAFTARFEPLLLRVCRRTLSRRGLPSGVPECRDALQDVFLAFLEDDRKALRAYRGDAGATVATYLSAVAVYRILGRRPRRRPSVPEPGFERASSEPGPLELLVRRETLASALETLQPRERLAMALQADGASVGEIGAALGVSRGAAAQILLRARGKFRE